MLSTTATLFLPFLLRLPYQEYGPSAHRPTSSPPWLPYPVGIAAGEAKCGFSEIFLPVVIFLEALRPSSSVKSKAVCAPGPVAKKIPGTLGWPTSAGHCWLAKIIDLKLCAEKRNTENGAGFFEISWQGKGMGMVSCHDDQRLFGIRHFTGLETVQRKF